MPYKPTPVIEKSKIVLQFFRLINTLCKYSALLFDASIINETLWSMIDLI